MMLQIMQERGGGSGGRRIHLPEGEYGHFLFVFLKEKKEKRRKHIGFPKRLATDYE
jgi:hypothetical protein